MRRLLIGGRNRLLGWLILIGRRCNGFGRWLGFVTRRFLGHRLLLAVLGWLGLGRL